MIYLIRRITKNFIIQHQNMAINDLPIKDCPVAETDYPDLDSYIENVLLKMGEDAFGFLLFIVPKALRININIVNLSTKA